MAEVKDFQPNELWFFSKRMCPSPFREEQRLAKKTLVSFLLYRNKFLHYSSERERTGLLYGSMIFLESLTTQLFLIKCKAKLIFAQVLGTYGRYLFLAHTSGYLRREGYIIYISKLSSVFFWQSIPRCKILLHNSSNFIGFYTLLVGLM